MWRRLFLSVNVSLLISMTSMRSGLRVRDARKHFHIRVAQRLKRHLLEFPLFVGKRDFLRQLVISAERAFFHRPHHIRNVFESFIRFQALDQLLFGVLLRLFFIVALRAATCAT